MAKKSGKPVMTETPELLLPPFNKSTQPLTVEEVAAIIRQHPRSVCRHARMGAIPGAFQVFGKSGVWRFKRKAFAQWWEAQGN